MQWLATRCANSRRSSLCSALAAENISIAAVGLASWRVKPQSSSRGGLATDLSKFTPQIIKSSIAILEMARGCGVMLKYVCVLQLCLLLLLALLSPMHSKNARPYDPAALPPQQRLRANVQDLFAGNQLSGKRAQELINDIAAAGNEQFEHLAGRLNGNSARKLRTAFLKRNQWPDLYWAEIRVLNLKNGREEKQWCAFLLPREYLHMIVRLGSRDVLLAREGCDPLTLQHLEKCERAARDQLVALGIWCDGVPVNWDRTESVETVSLKFPGQPGKYKSLRLPVTSVSHKQFSEHTWDDIMEVVAYSLISCATGCRPRGRHDFREWLASDVKRKKLVAAGDLALGVRAALCEACGDWKMFG